MYQISCDVHGIYKTSFAYAIADKKDIFRELFSFWGEWGLDFAHIHVYH